MALTMTRTRTQTALTKLAEIIASVHGELDCVEGLLTGSGLGPGATAKLVARQHKLTLDRDALYATIRQFDAKIEPTAIISRKPYKNKNLRDVSQVQNK